MDYEYDNKRGATDASSPFMRYAHDRLQPSISDSNKKRACVELKWGCEPLLTAV